MGNDLLRLIERYVEARICLNAAAMSNDYDYGSADPGNGPIGFQEAASDERQAGSALREAISGWDVGASRTNLVNRFGTEVEVVLTKREGKGIESRISPRSGPH
jgi:hypothetical protein